MDDRREKRRLKLMNEVLPLPTQADSVTAPRARTLAHMQRLLTVTAAGAALAGCTKPDATPDAGTSSPDKATAATTATAAPTMSATAEATAPVPPSSASAAPSTSASTTPTASASAKHWPPPRRPVPVVDPLPRPPQRDPNGGF